jgi:hypothetical protein
MQKILPIFAFAAGIYAALGIWFPRFRGHWKGTKMTCGPVSCAVFALFLIGIGTVSFVGDAVQERHRIWLLLFIIVSWILGAIGYVLDGRTYARISPQPSIPSSARRGFRPEQRGWLFVAFGVSFLIMFLWLFVFHK